MPRHGMAELRYLAFRIQQRLRGFDPDLIGEHEVKPLRCPNCHATLPWNLVKQFLRNHL